ncbi:hypothetical protein PFISCL1PPCAC_21372, partial [Pristionchus fissidentatus]
LINSSMSFHSLNSTALARLRLVQEYVTILVELEGHLSLARMSAARARTVVGHTYASLTGVDDVEEMEATVRVEVTSSGEFSLCKSEDEEKEKKEEGVRKRKDKKGKTEESSEEEEEKPKKKSAPPPPAFRPFGILEPIAAKQARGEAARAAELAIAAATVRAKIIDCDRQTKEQLAGLEKTQLDTVFSLLSVN